MTTDAAELAILNVLAARGAGKSIAPAEAARALAGEAAGDQWRHALSPIRLAALRLATAGRIELLRKGKPVAPAEARGVIRLRLVAPAA